MASDADRLLMSAALSLAARGVGKTSPNPAVGSIIAKEGQIVGRGWHKGAGLPHAEAEALSQAGEKARGSTAYVTLEPCSHFGRTPPCADALIAAGVRRVVAAMEDPNPIVAGKGFGKLRAAGIEVETGVMAREAALLNEGFCLSVVKKRPFVHLKLAATLDGKIASRTGDSKWITGEKARESVHRLRQRCGAVMAGVGTANADDPELNARLGGESFETLRFILDRDLRLSPEKKLARPPLSAFTTVFCSAGASPEREERLRGQGVKVVRTGEGDKMDLKAVLAHIHSLGRMELLLEGGARAAYEFLRAGLVDRCHFFYSPRLLCGEGKPMLSGAGPEKIADALRLSEVESSLVGEDLYLTGRIFGEGE